MADFGIVRDGQLVTQARFQWGLDAYDHANRIRDESRNEACITRLGTARLYHVTVCPEQFGGRTGVGARMI
jgi:aldehyde:ferredoxin oxidoreductase